MHGCLRLFIYVCVCAHMPACLLVLRDVNAREYKHKYVQWSVYTHTNIASTRTRYEWHETLENHPFYIQAQI